MSTIPKLLTLHEVADLTGRSLNTVRKQATRQIATGKGLGIPVVQPNGPRGRRFAREHDLVKMLNTNASAAETPADR